MVPGTFWKDQDEDEAFHLEIGLLIQSSTAEADAQLTKFLNLVAKRSEESLILLALLLRAGQGTRPTGLCVGI